MHLIFTNHWDSTFYHNFIRTMETGDQLLQALFAKKSDPKVKALYDFYLPIYTAYRERYIFWQLKTKDYRGSSYNLDVLFQDLAGTQINTVDVFLKNIYVTEKANYITLMPNNKGPFQTGRQMDRIWQSEQLADSMLLRNELSPVSQNFKDFSVLLGAGSDLQHLNKQNVKSASSDLEKKRVLLAGGLFWVYGGLIQIYYLTPDDIGEFYEINQMFAKKAGQAIINPDVVVVELAPLETKEAGMNFVPTDVINASVVGNGDIEFWITDGSPANANTKKGIIHAGEEFLIRPPEWATSDCRYLYFKCTDTEFSTIVHLVKVIPVM